jgi:type III restriction enzyme
MGLHKDFPKSPYAILDPDIRWFPAQETLREKGYDKLLPPLVAQLRKKVKAWRDKGYEGASTTSKALLLWWFETQHPIIATDGSEDYFRYYFAQREAVETIIYLYEVAEIRDKYDLLRYDSSGAVSAGMLPESWPRYVVKMATGAGKTKVLSLILAWSFFHRIYEPDSALSRNFLVIAPNIIVLDRLRADFDGLKIFHHDPVLPPNGHEGQNWKDDFQVTLHIQDEVNVVRKYGNIFLTNIHRVYDSNREAPSSEDEDTSEYFLGPKPVAKTQDSKVDLGVIVRDVDELVVLNDEAHHIHDEDLAWFKSIQDIHNRLVMKGGRLPLQVDTTATPRHDNGAIFVQTICDYPLVEAIHQDVVKRPILPDAASRAKLVEKKSSKYTEKYEDYIHLGFLEWQKAHEEHRKMDKKAVFFVMTDDTKNCDEVAAYLEGRYPEFKDAVLTIHTKKNGEIAESVTGKNKDELDILRQAANSVDQTDNRYKAIVSVMMLKEGWDVRNVTTIVGLRPYASQSNILPEQTLGRGLRRMYRNPEVQEFVSVVGTDAFMDFVESIKNEGVELEHRSMGAGTAAKTPIVVEVDHDNPKKDIAKLDIELPILTPRIYREYKNLSNLEPGKFGNAKLMIRQFSEEQKREIVFRDIVKDEINHYTILDSALEIDPTSVIGWFTRTIMRDLRLVSGYDILYGKVKNFIQEHLFETPVDLEDLNILRNLSELEATKTIIDTFKNNINELTVQDRGEAAIRETIKISKCRPFVTKDQSYVVPKLSAFNKIVGDSHLELEFAAFLETCEGEIISYAKNFMAVNFKLDYQNASGEISNYYPDFIVKRTEKEIFIIETKGLEDLDVPLKIARLKQWCEDVNSLQKQVKFDWVLVDEEGFRKFKPKTFAELVKAFKKYK